MYDYFEHATKNLTVDELSKFSRLFRKKKKSVRVTFVCWLFGSGLGLHRFYTGNYGTAFGLMAITILTCGLGVIAGLYDGVNLKRLVEDSNKGITLEIVKEVKRK